MGVEDDNQSRSSERVASHKRTPRHNASPTPIAESVASAPSFQLTNSLVVCGSYVKYDGIMKATIVTIAITGGPMRITKSISARVRAEHFQSRGLHRRPTAAATIVAVALMVSNKARTRVIPRNVYITDSAVRVSSPGPGDRVR